MLQLYKTITSLSYPVLGTILRKRVRRGKEDPARLDERKGISKTNRPDGILFWVHAASVGEAQSALILIQHLLNQGYSPHILITTGTLTSAKYLSAHLPERCIHQFYPLDHPQWVKRFLNHWQPDACFWMESELWPNMLAEIKARKIPAVLVNARMSEKSFKRWGSFRKLAHDLLSTFNLILSQTDKEAGYYKSLGAQNIKVTDNLKYSAGALKFDASLKSDFEQAIQSRPVWLYASTHQGEEELASSIHQTLIRHAQLKNLLTIIVPRHPERGAQIADMLGKNGLQVVQRSTGKNAPDNETDIYLADTIGELGLFYSLSPLAVIGRSFSDDGGGGHNPIEAAQLGCAVLHGPAIQNLAEIYDEMDRAGGATEVKSADHLADIIASLLSDEAILKDRQDKAVAFAASKTAVINRVMNALEPMLKTVTQ